MIIKGLRCRLGLHHPDNKCKCKRCGVIVHKYKTYREWVDEEGIDAGLADGGVWLAYNRAEYEIKHCVRCGDRIMVGPLRFSGHG